MCDKFQHNTPSYKLTASIYVEAGSFLTNLERKRSTSPHQLNPSRHVLRQLYFGL